MTRTGLRAFDGCLIVFCVVLVVLVGLLLALPYYLRANGNRKAGQSVRKAAGWTEVQLRDKAVDGVLTAKEARDSVAGGIVIGYVPAARPGDRVQVTVHYSVVWGWVPVGGEVSKCFRFSVEPQARPRPAVSRKEIDCP
ncbi:hypothetical protein [Actinomadura rubrisoli]|uniref:Uncharacterized protein n=1 Tax=Actinomadura rubrisoli TaxID=2530368 RepID=A0A4V2YSL5_9ACTN|nr:hypothetical protein [Actinomadura rubrisoli]TDD70577.1 hypothetical protein E1298_36570 [Actinomadura rubrisoli]